ITGRLVEQLERLAPFGQGNARPVLGASGVTVLGARRMGADGTHVELQLGQGPGQLRLVAFGRGDLAESLPAGTRRDVRVAPRLNHCRGRTSVEAELVDVRALAARPAAGSAAGA